MIASKLFCNKHLYCFLLRISQHISYLYSYHSQYKKLYNQIAYAYHAKTLLNPLLEGELRQGNGKAYGFELLLKKTLGRLTGQISYGFTRSLLQIDGLNGNRIYFGRYSLLDAVSVN